MILAPIIRICDVCMGNMHLMWKEDGSEWIYVFDDPPVHDKVHLKMKCESCGCECSPYGTTQEEIDSYNEIRYSIIKTMVDKGLYSWRSE